MKKSTAGRIRFLAFVFAILFTLSACAVEDQNDQKIVKYNWENYYIDFIMSAEILTQHVKVEEAFEVEVGFAQLFDPPRYDSVTFNIYAKNINILVPDGTTFEERYKQEIPDFSQYKCDDEKEMPERIETFRFNYTGTKPEHEATFTFYLSNPLPESNESTSSGIYIDIYYIVRDGYITVTTKRPKKFKDNLD